MYQPTQFKLTDQDEIVRIVKSNPLATLIVSDDDGLQVNHLPILADTGADGLIRLRLHVARANPVWQTIDRAGDVLAVFCGVQTYISPNWYASKKRDGKVVPTWNYEAVHVRGTVSVHDDANWLRGFLTELTALHEADQQIPWQLGDAPDEYIDMRLRGIVGIELAVTDVQAKGKLSQNQPPENRRSVIAGLRAPARSDGLPYQDQALRARMADSIPDPDAG